MACSFLQGKRHGQGVQVVRGAYQYTGAWQEDRRCGPGTCTYADGSVYEGEWRKDAYHGQGCFKGADGSAYEGGWLDGKQHGQGEPFPNMLYQSMRHAGCPHSMYKHNYVCCPSCVPACCLLDPSSFLERPTGWYVKHSRNLHMQAKQQLAVLNDIMVMLTLGHVMQAGHG
jgi:hypothetical protein